MRSSKVGIVAGCLAALAWCSVSTGVRADDVTRVRSDNQQDQLNLVQKKSASPVSVEAIVPSEGDIVLLDDGTPRGPGDLVTGFESSGLGLLFNLGSVEPQNGWAATGVNLAWQQIVTLNPAAGTQNMRFIRNAAAANGTQHQMFSQTLPPPGAGASVMSLDIAISNAGGADYFIQPQAVAQGFLTNRIRFAYNDSDSNGGPDIRVLDLAPTLTEVNTGANWIPGTTYRNLRMEIIPSIGRINYFYNGVKIYEGAVVAGSNIDQFYTFHDNWQLGGETADFDNLSITALTGSGACCDLINGTCDDTASPNDCIGTGKTYTHGQTCVQIGCGVASGACCLVTGCVEDQTIAQCDALGGNFTGDGTTCAVSCPGPFCQSGGDGQTPDFENARTSDAHPSNGLRAADNFTPAANGTVTSVRWWGIYYNFTAGTVCTAPASDDFRIAFFDDAANRPDTLLSGPTTVSVTRTLMTQQIAGGPVYQYDATLPVGVNVTADTCYWMEIQNTTTDGQCFWLWMTSNIGDAVMAQHGGALPYGPGSTVADDVAWCLNIDVNPDGCDSATQFPGACCVANDVCLDDESAGSCAALGGVFGGSQSTCATTICPQACQAGGDGQVEVFGGSGGFIGNFSDLNVGLRAADNFTPSASTTITSVRWWGLYLDPFNEEPVCDGSVVADNFQIRFFNDASDVPFQVIAGPFSGGDFATFTKTATNGVKAGAVGNFPVYRYQVTGLNVPVSANQCYWMEIVNNTTGDCIWLWSAGPSGDLKSAEAGAAGTYTAPDDQVEMDLAWCVTGDVNPDGCDSAIELPGACCLNQGTVCDDSEGVSGCVQLGGTFLGVGTTCAEADCRGACCVGDSCSFVIEQQCDVVLAGIFFGVGEPCTPNPCSGSCCLPDGFCIDSINKDDCEIGFNGSYWGGQSCVTTTCASNEICAPVVTDGLQLSCGESITINNSTQANATTPPVDAQPDFSCFGGGPSNGVGASWLSFVGTGGEVEISTCGSAVADTVLAVYTNPAKTCNQFDESDEVACDEDSTFCANPLQSRICVPSTVMGQLYYVQVTSWSAASVGLITVNMVCPCSEEPVQCTCPGDVNGDNSRNGADIQAFVNCLLGTGGNCDCADANESGGLDPFGAGGDIETFVGLLLNSTGACP